MRLGYPPLEEVGGRLDTAQVCQALLVKSAREGEFADPFLQEGVRAEHLRDRFASGGEPAHRVRLICDDGIRHSQSTLRSGDKLRGFVGGICQSGRMIHPQHGQRAEHTAEAVLGLQVRVGTLGIGEPTWELVGARRAIPHGRDACHVDLLCRGADPTGPAVPTQLSGDTELRGEPRGVHAMDGDLALMQSAHDTVGGRVDLIREDQN